jgi:hypothetical protein
MKENQYGSRHLSVVEGIRGSEALTEVPEDLASTLSLRLVEDVEPVDPTSNFCHNK